MLVLAPNRMVMTLLSIAGSIKAISKAEDMDEKPREYRQVL